MGEKPLPYRDLRAILKRFGAREEKGRGKGSHRMLIRVVEGQERSYPIKCHKESEVKPRAVIRALRRNLLLREEDGVSDEQFYSN